jgi:hypothetical protein
MSDQYNNPDDELDAADRRIDQILKSGGTAQPSRPAQQPTPADQYESEDAIARARGRVNATRQQLGIGDASQARRRMSGAPSLTGSGRNTQALMLIGGLVGAGVIVVLIIILAANALKGGGINLPGFATDTPTPTITPTPAPTATPTKIAPSLNLPPLTCIFQSGTGCSDYCAEPSHLTECNTARTFLEAQGVDSNVFFNCLSPSSGPNTGNPVECIRQGWYAKNP